MHAIKGAWAGQTFALAKSHESGGRKARIRRSKEERKAMVESFIKKYQSLNNGNFPTLNLAHKEVGGSFYTVREIVREIIQENRVLGPGKWTEDEQKAEQFLNEHPLGSISIEPEYSLSSSASGNNVQSDLSGSNKSLFVVDGLIVDSDNDKYEKEQIIDGSTMNLKDGSGKEIYGEYGVNGNAMVLEDESGEDFGAEVEVNGISVELKDESDKEINTESEVNRIASELKDESDKEVSAVLEVSVEPGPNGVAVELQDKSNQEFSSEMEVNGSAMDLEHESAKEVSVKFGTMESDIKPFTSTYRVTQITTDVIVETFPLRPVSSSTDIDASSVETKNLTETSDMLFEKKSALVNSIPSPEASEQSTPIVSQTQGGQSDSTPKIDEKIVSSSNGLPKINVAIPGNAIGESNKNNVQHHANSRRNTATLNRINLESWEGTAKGKAASETNPLLSIFKSFITAFVKFWS